ncbi:hypothetical protein SLS62_011146 [Diatrype stigma]|uniref:Uncharacterized protein n=1 Tax=Diatrype stigma TaxID=117547 RepID=A0AAN9U7A6_9PEZI
MALDIKQLNTDTSFLLSFKPIPPELGAVVDVISPRPFTILLDPVIKNPPSFSLLTPISTNTGTFADASTTAAAPPSPSSTNDDKLTLTSLRELPEAPDLVIISQAGRDHCDETTLRQLPGSGTRTLIIAEPAAAHVIHSWRHFDRDKVRIIEPWEDPRLALEYRPVVARVVVPAVRVTSGIDTGRRPSSQLGQPGEVTVSLVMPETNKKKAKKQQAQTQAQMLQQKKQQQQKQKKHKRRGSSCGLSPGAAAAQAAAGIAGAIGITYRPPTIPGLEPLRIPVLAALHQHLENRGPALYGYGGAPPPPPETYGNSSGSGSGNNALRQTKTLSIVVPDAESVLCPSSPPISPRSLRSVQSHAVISNSAAPPPPPTAFPPFLTAAALIADRENNNNYSHFQPQRRPPPTPPLPPQRVPTPAPLTQEQLDKEHQKQRPTSYFYKPRPPSSALSTAASTSASTANRSSNGNTGTDPTSWASAAARLAAAKKAAATASRPLSVVYAPHGTAFPHLAAWTSSHLLQEAALPLTALLHPMDGVVLGATVRAQIRTAQEASARPASSSSSSTSSWSSWSSTLGRLRFGGGGSNKAATAAAQAAAATGSSVVCAGAEIASRMAARLWVSVNDGGAARGSRRWACDEPVPDADTYADADFAERRLSNRGSSSKNGGGGGAGATPITKVLRLGSGYSITVCADEVVRPDWAEDDYMEEMEDDEDDYDDEDEEAEQERTSFANTTLSFVTTNGASIDQGRDGKKKSKPKNSSSIDVSSIGHADHYQQNDNKLLKTKSKTQQASLNEYSAAAITPVKDKDSLAPPKKKRGLRTKASFLRLGLGGKSRPSA